MEYSMGDEILDNIRRARARLSQSRNWRIVVYDKHIGLVDSNDNSIVNIIGDNLEIARLIVRAVNAYKEESV